MKLRLLISILFSLVLFAACNKKSQTEPEETFSLISEWKIIEITYTIDTQTTTLTETQLNESGQIWNLVFNNDQTFEQTSNMAGDGALSTQTGTFSTAGNQLTFIFISPSGLPSIIYYYSVTNSQLNLTRSFSIPNGTQKVVGKFRRQ